MESAVNASKLPNLKLQIKEFEWRAVGIGRRKVNAKGEVMLER